MTNVVYVLHVGPTVLGVYTTPSQLTEAVADWHNEFMRRFERGARQDELPRMTFMRVNMKPGAGQQIGDEDSVVLGEAN